MRDRKRKRERGRDTGRGRSCLHAGSLIGTRSWVSRITPWAEGGAKPLSHPGCPIKQNFYNGSAIGCVNVISRS